MYIDYRLTDAELTSKTAGGWTWEDEEFANPAKWMLVSMDAESKLLNDPMRSSWWNIRQQFSQPRCFAHLTIAERWKNDNIGINVQPTTH